MISEVYNEDCMVGMARYPDKYFDLCISDPPYGVDLKYNTYIDTLENWYDLMNKFIPQARRVSKMVIIPSCSIKKMGWIYKNHEPDWLICWYKGSVGANSWIGFNDWEPLLVYGKTDGICMHDYLKLSNTEKMGSSNHPCPKPVDWSRILIKKALKDGGTVLDCFLGSGSSRIAAYDLKFDFVGFELDKEYFDASVKRFENYKLQLKLF